MIPIALFLAPSVSAAPAPDATVQPVGAHQWSQYQILGWPFVQYNAGEDYPPGVPQRLMPAPGEEGQFVAVRFDADQALWVDEIAYYAPNSDENGVNCTVTRSRQMDLYVAFDDEPPVNAVPDRTITVPGIRSAPIGGVKFHVPITPLLAVPEGASLFVAVQLSGEYPTDLDCMLFSPNRSVDRVDTEFWSFATAPPFAWEGLDALGIANKALMSIEGLMSLL